MYYAGPGILICLFLFLSFFSSALDFDLEGEPLRVRVAIGFVQRTQA